MYLNIKIWSSSKVPNLLTANKSEAKHSKNVQSGSLSKVSVVLTCCKIGHMSKHCTVYLIIKISSSLDNLKLGKKYMYVNIVKLLFDFTISDYLFRCLPFLRQLLI